MSRNIRPHHEVRYNANCAGVVGGYNGPTGPIEARLRQQEELDRKAAAHAIKLKEKEEEKRQKRIKRWEFMNGMGPGQFVGGSEYDVIPYLEQGERVVVRQEAMEAARQRMQHEHATQTARARLDLRNVPANEQRIDNRAKEREEAKRLKKIADWERMNGVCGSSRGRVLGGGAQSGGNPSVLLGESSHVERQMAFPHTLQTKREKHVSGETSTAKTSTCQSASSNTPHESGADEELSEQAQRDAMRAARLRMQQNMNKIIEEQKAKEQQKEPPPPTFTPSKRLAAKFNQLDFS